MAAAKKTASKPNPGQPDEPAQPQSETPSFVDEVHQRGGWSVGYVGDRVDDADDDTYTVAGVLKAASGD